MIFYEFYIMDEILLKLKNNINIFIEKKTDNIDKTKKTFKLLNELPLVKELKNENKNLKNENKNLKNENKNLKNENLILKKKILNLKNEIVLYSNRKNNKKNIKLIINDTNDNVIMNIKKEKLEVNNFITSETDGSFHESGYENSDENSDENSGDNFYINTGDIGDIGDKIQCENQEENEGKNT